jgi:hypothetical protein
MTVSVKPSFKSYSGDGSITAFSTVFEFEDSTDLVVLLQTGTATPVTQTITTHYTVAGGAGSTGTVTFVTAPPATDTVWIFRWRPMTQATDYTTNDSFPADSHEDAIDKLCEQVQQVADRTGGTEFDFDATQATLDSSAIIGGLRITGGTSAQLITLLQFGATVTEGMRVMVLEETVTGLAAVSTDLSNDVPSGAVIIGVQANIEVLVVAGGTSVKVGIGPTADPDKYAITGDLLLNTKADGIPDWAVLSSAEDVQINMCATGGGIGDTVATAGSVRVRIYYLDLNSLDNA